MDLECWKWVRMVKLYVTIIEKAAATIKPSKFGARKPFIYCFCSACTLFLSVLFVQNCIKSRFFAKMRPSSNSEPSNLNSCKKKQKKKGGGRDRPSVRN